MGRPLAPPLSPHRLWGRWTGSAHSLWPKRTINSYDDALLLSAEALASDAEEASFLGSTSNLLCQEVDKFPVGCGLPLRCSFEEYSRPPTLRQSIVFHAGRLWLHGRSRTLFVHRCVAT